jgi:ABC-type amino acid transport system permease subunit
VGREELGVFSSGAFGSIIMLVFLFAAFQVVGVIAAFVSLFQRTDQQVVGDSRILWALVVLFIPLGFVAYFLLGRREVPPPIL